jgi:hypothetical protein
VCIITLGIAMKNRTLALTLLLSCALAQPSPPVLRGTWTATAGPKQIFRGKWSAQTLPDTPNAARGSWALLNSADQIVAEGTWSAEKSARGWQGTWSARVQTGRSSLGRPTLGRPLSGAWQAQMENFKGKTSAEMLQQTLEKQIAGSWRSSRARGNWWLKGSAY